MLAACHRVTLGTVETRSDATATTSDATFLCEVSVVTHGDALTQTIAVSYTHLTLPTNREV